MNKGIKKHGIVRHRFSLCMEQKTHLPIELAAIRDQISKTPNMSANMLGILFDSLCKTVPLPSQRRVSFRPIFKGDGFSTVPYITYYFTIPI